MSDIHAHDKMIEGGLNLIQQALSIFDSDLRLVLINRPMQQMFSLPDHIVEPGAPFDRLIRFLAERGEYGPIDDPEEFISARVKLARAFEPHYMERTRANGRTISVEGAPLPQGGWITVYTDITAVKRQEELLRARSEVLSDQVLARSEELAATNRELASTIATLEETKHQLTLVEARTRLTTQMMPAHIAHMNMDRRYTFSNRRLNDVIPYNPNDIVGLHARDALGIDAYSAIEPHLNRAYQGHAATFEFSHTPSSRRIRVAFTPDKDSSDTVQGVYVLSMDVTEETQARVALQQTRRREMAAQLTSGLAHDFSNLLTIILGMQSKLERMDDLPSPAAPLINATLSAARRGGTLLGRIADMTGPREFRPVSVSLTDFLRDLVVLADTVLGQTHTLDILVDTPDPAYQLDPGLLQDCLLNLIINARDASPKGGKITLKVQTHKDTWLDWTLSDTGPGFSEKALKHALEPFFTTKGDEGTGLGLAMAYDMTKLAGGSIRIFNESGAHIRLRLPLRPVAPKLPAGLVLLVEDNDDLRAHIRSMLIDTGHMVLEATSVHEAETLISTVPDIARVLSDIRLAGVRTGLDLCALTDLPVTLMTSLPTSHPLHKAAKARGAVLAKPFSAEIMEQGLKDADLQTRKPVS